MSRKLRDFVRLDAQNIPVSGSNVRRAKKPSSGRWLEIENVDCCGPTLVYAAVATIINPVFVLKCGVTTLFTINLTATTASLQATADLLNNNIGFVGYFSVDGANIQLQTKSDIKAAFCPAGTLTFTVIAA